MLNMLPAQLSPNAGATQSHGRRGSRNVLLAVVVGLLALAVTACDIVPPAPGANLVAESAEVYANLNQFRGENGLAALPHGAELDAKAQAHAQHMANTGQLFHSTLTDGVSPGWMMLGENVAVAGNATAAQGALENSPGHRAQMLNPNFTNAGIGAVRAGNTVWVVQVFEQR